MPADRVGSLLFNNETADKCGRLFDGRNHRERSHAASGGSSSQKSLTKE
jgi:hypothetical protein